MIVLFYIILLIQSTWTTEDGSLCKEDMNITRLGVLPGRGWDNLRNIEMLDVFDIDFSECAKSLDGMYIIPANVQIIPKQSSRMETFSELIENYESSRSLLANSINVNTKASVSCFSISGSFSDEHQEIRSKQINTQSITSRVQLRQRLFTVLSGQGIRLNRRFRDRLLDISFQIVSNKTNEASYFADMLILEYGTHVVNRIDAGGIIWMTDSVKTLHKKLSTSEKTKISASASAGFGGLFKVSTSFSHESAHSDVKGYENNLTSREMGSYGGDPVRPGVNISDWSTSLHKNPVAIDVDGESLDLVINNIYLGESLPYEVIGKVRECVKEAIDRYYKANAVFGCMRPEAKNFEPEANIPSRDCDVEESSFALGGFFQRCSGPNYLCNGHIINNIVTGGLKCPHLYREVLLHSRQFISNRKCGGWGAWRSCHVDRASYFLYWCAAEKVKMPSQSGFLFGGIFTAQSRNLLTGSLSCPPTFFKLSYGAGDISVCLSRDFELSKDYRVDFGGFFSCQSGNLYTILPDPRSNHSDVSMVTVRTSLRASEPKKWSKKCPTGYSQHVGLIDNGCEILFCMRRGEHVSVERQRVKRPPFVHLTSGEIPRPRINRDLHFESGTWMYNSTNASWQHHEKKRLTSIVGVLASLLGTMCLGGIITMFIMVRRRRKRSSHIEYESLTGVNVEVDEVVATE